MTRIKKAASLLIAAMLIFALAMPVAAATNEESWILDVIVFFFCPEGERVYAGYVEARFYKNDIFIDYLGPNDWGSPYLRIPDVGATMPKVEIDIISVPLLELQNLGRFPVEVEVRETAFGNFWFGDLMIYLGELEDTPPEPTPPETLPTNTLSFTVGSTTYSNAGTPGTLDAAPFNEAGRIMVPLRNIVEAFGVEPQWNDGVISFTITGVDFVVTVGQPLPDDAGTPVIVNDRTFVPLRWVINGLNLAYEWDGDANTAHLFVPN